MHIKQLSLKNFRNYSSESFEFSKNVNILTGDNAQGKTNCAEAIFFLCTGYSPRATRDKQVVKYGEKCSEILGIASSKYGDIKVEIKFSPSKGKDVLVNGVQIKKIGELMGNINSVFFNPEELKLIKESPEDRRRFLDIALSQINKNYFYSLQKYKKILEQRNSLLKNPDREVIYATLPLWDEKLCEYAEVIIKERKSFIELLYSYAKDIHLFITSGKEDFEVLEDSSFEVDYEDVKGSLKNALALRYEKDIILGYTSVGPHRDDLKIKISGEDVRVYGSQGQQRTSAITLKLAELEIFKEKLGEYPVLILDDALSELDKSRRAKLLERIENIQTIITCTELTSEMLELSGAKHFEIGDGKIISVKTVN